MNHLLDPKEGFVYFYQSGTPCSNGNLVKIGVTRRGETAEERVIEIDRNQPYRGKLIFSIQSKDCYKTEQLLHNYYSGKRTELGEKREWFIFTKRDVQDILNLKFPPSVLYSISQDSSSLNTTEEFPLKMDPPFHDTHISNWKGHLIHTPFYDVPVSFLLKCNNLKLLQSKLIHLLLYRIFHTKKRDILTFSVLDVQQLTGSSSLYDFFKKNVNELSSQTYDCPSLKRKIRYVDYCSYNNGCFKLRLSEEFYSLLTDIDPMKIQINIFHIIKCKRLYSINMFGVLSSVLNTVFEKQIALNELKSILLGEEVSRYEFYGHFKEKVIKPALLEIKKLTKWNIEILELKQYRKVTHLEFRRIPTKNN